MDVSALVEWYETHKKFIVAVVAAVATIVAFAGDGEFSLNDVLGTIAVLTGAGGVERVANKTKRRAQLDRAARDAKGK